MLDLLDQVGIGGGVISENHDTSKINVGPVDIDGGLRRMLGLWDASEMGISREEVERRISEANTPEAREKLMADLRARAIKRAGLDTTGGRVRLMVAGKPAWHDLGVLVRDAVTSEDAILHAGLDIEMLKIPMAYQLDGKTYESKDTFAIVRSDTGVQFGTVGSRYQIIQNRDGFAYLDEVLKEYGARYESAGSLYDGRKVFMLAQLPNQSFKLKGNDEVQPYVLFTNTHDGSGAASCFPTALRVECANTLRVASGRRKSGINIRHTGDVKAKVAAAQQALGLAVSGFATFKDNAEVMSRSACEPNGYFHDLLDSVLDISKAEADQGADALVKALGLVDTQREFEHRKLERQITQRKDLFEDLLERYEQERCGKAERGTIWAALNAVTESVDHGKAGGNFRGQGKESRRFESAIAGRGDAIKQIAYTQALARV